MKLSPPGTAGTGTNPEQLFAAGYSACFIGAMKAVAGMQKISLPADLSIDASVDLGKVGQGYGIAARLAVSLPGMDRATAQALVDAAHQVCPYSNATPANSDLPTALVPRPGPGTPHTAVAPAQGAPPVCFLGCPRRKP